MEIDLSADKIMITGACRAGKTTAVSQLDTDHAILHTDDFKDRPWAEIPYLILDWAAGRDRWLIEGVSGIRALRKGLTADVVYWFDKPVIPVSKTRLVMNKGLRTIRDDWGGEYILWEDTAGSTGNTKTTE